MFILKLAVESCYGSTHWITDYKHACFWGEAVPLEGMQCKLADTCTKFMQTSDLALLSRPAPLCPFTIYYKLLGILCHCIDRQCLDFSLSISFIYKFYI